MTATPGTPQVVETPSIPVFIEDGWTIKGRIEAEPGQFPTLTFHYRPMTWLERRRLAREQEAEKDQEKQDLIRAKQMVTRIIDWDAGDAVSESRICQLHPILFSRLESVLFGIGQADKVEVERKN